jgi:hypothetical protein
MAPFDHRSSHDENVFLLHQRDAFFTQVTTMLNGFYARIKSIHDSFFGVAMCSDRSPSSRSLIKHNLQFFGRELCVQHTVNLTEDPSTGAGFDEFGAFAELQADCPDTTIYAITDC